MLENKWHLWRKCLVSIMSPEPVFPMQTQGHSGLRAPPGREPKAQGGQGMKGRGWLCCVLSARESAGEPRQQWPKDSWHMGLICRQGYKREKYSRDEG